MNTLFAAAPASSWRRFYFISLLLTLVFRGWLGAVLPFTGDEAYFYWWGKIPAGGFYDHPPMVGWWLAALISVSEAEWWLRLPSILQPALLSSLMLAVLRDDAPAVRWGTATLMLLAPAGLLDVLITTDIPLVYFSVASALAFLHAQRSRSMPAFALAGLLLGGAFLSKYFSVLLGLAYIAWAVWRPAAWKWKGLGLLVLCALPAGLYNAWWNSQHCWANVMFNVFNRHGNAHLGWQTPLLYLVMMVWLLTPMVAWRLVRAPSGWLRQPALPWLVCVPLAVFALLSLLKTIGLHWVFSFVPLAFLMYARSVDAATLRRTVNITAVIAAVHAVALLAIGTTSVESWEKRLGERRYAGIVQTVKADELIAALGDDLERYVPMTDGYSPSVTLGYNHRRYWAVFGPASSHARHDDMLTDFRTLAGRDILILSKEKPDLADYTPYFRDVSEDTLQVRGATFWRIRGHGFDYAAYHKGVLEPARRLWYAIPKWLPDCGCYFEERYFGK
ncbi:Putative glycosyl transferase family 39 [Methyloversatilis universalis FAM5]|uniref:Glycosyl transferase family 39 n=1 Tax=Methyloversatilis universalis (strain ATCC BAA-1314 / DSM 25237 / JCM 13912 / CCUG 52030 / FAM5) TaxID=1000565 RepID=F5RI49_METUF|nr:glycosyltransferase family 39 protein [Methyloversatilis universalis]EGK70030.1 Putative glycosyl transferase family 39 [Methyloversatilis universalis FAM5]